MSLKRQSLSEMKKYLDRMSDFFQAEMEIAKSKNDLSRFSDCLEIIRNIKGARLKAESLAKAS